jgi:hypothetical protein
VLHGHVADDDRDDRLAQRLGQFQLLLAFDGGQRLGRREQDDGLAHRIGLAQRLAPARAGVNAV